MVTPRWCPLSRACPTKNALALAISDTGKIAPAKTASLPHRTGKRRGTTVREERIDPVLYSPLENMTPSTPKAITAKVTPARLVETGLTAPPAARPGGPGAWCWLAVMAEIRAPRPITRTTPASIVHRLERRERNFVNSDFTTRSGVTRRAGSAGRGTAASVATALIGPPPSRRAHGSGSRQCCR